MGCGVIKKSCTWCAQNKVFANCVILCTRCADEKYVQVVRWHKVCWWCDVMHNVRGNGEKHKVCSGSRYVLLV